MEITSVRRARLKEWVDGEFAGRISDMCSYYMLPPSYQSYINQMLSGHRNIGERAARALETRCGRPQGWLDTVPTQEAPRALSFDETLVAKLPREDVELIEEFIGLIITRNERRTVQKRAKTVLNFAAQSGNTNLHNPRTESKRVLNGSRKRKGSRRDRLAGWA